MKKINRIKELVIKLNDASMSYYQQAREKISNYEYDKLYDELEQLQKETGFIMSNSPTQKVGYEIISGLEKERHEKPMLSLDKTKEISSLVEFTRGHSSILSWKMDGLTIVLTYNNGELVKAVTRGNGEVGEVVTNNAKTFKNIPLKIAFKGELIIRGEAVIRYSDFEKINEAIEDDNDKYKNPRNLCSGSVRQLNSEITAKRNVNLFVFSLVKADGVDFNNSHLEQFNWLEKLGFEVVDHELVTEDDIEDAVEKFEKRIPDNDFPSDGLVLLYDNIDYGNALGTTAKFPRNSIAFKWQDETAVTKLLEVEWSASRTGLLNPIAIFEPVELEGTTVSRASVHNISIMKELELGIGDEIEVFKANMIIPQIAKNITKSSAVYIPDKCPVCGGETELKKINEGESLYCTNSECPAKKIKLFSLMVSRDAMNIDGMSEATLQKFIENGILHDITDLFHISDHKEKIIKLEGFGEKSYNNFVNEIEKKKHITLSKLIYGLGILNVGLSNAKLICKNFNNDAERIMTASDIELSHIDGVGPVIAKSFTDYFADENKAALFRQLLKEVILEKEEQPDENEQIFTGLNFVITGTLTKYENRNQLKTLIQQLGGKVTGSVTSKTNYLINNDITSSSSKNKKAKELDIPIISEEDFSKLL